MTDTNLGTSGTAASGSPTPLADADPTPPPASTTFEPAGSVGDKDVAFTSAAEDTDSADNLAFPELPTPPGQQAQGDAQASGTGERQDPKQALRDSAQKFTAQAGDKARGFAEQGKAKAEGALDQLVQMLNDAADTVESKVGAQYGQYARTAATTVSGFADQVKAKQVDELLEDARVLVRKSPGIAIGTAAAVGFVLSRLATAGIDGRDKAGPGGAA